MQHKSMFCMRFLSIVRSLQQPETEASSSIVTQVFGCELSNNFKCRCGHMQSRAMTSCILDLNYHMNGARLLHSRQCHDALL